jgi:curved DNA-binding protein CbpA
MKRSDYEILKVDPSASFQEIKKAYKKQAMAWHPDRFPTADEKQQTKASQMFNQITEAFTRLEVWHSNLENGKYAEDQPSASPFEGPQGAEDNDWHDDFTPDMPKFVTRKWPNGNKYEGMAFDEMMHGQGMFSFADGSIFTGQFQFDKMNGIGKMVFANGDIYSGGFYDGHFHGEGKMMFANGDRYMGTFAEDTYHGHGIFISNKGEVFSGQWDHGSLMADDGPQDNFY